MRKPELLAPAGNREAFEAALAAGADAIYLGSGSFNARRNADNFEIDDLRAACRDAHLRDARVYLTANTLVFPGEMDDALAMVAAAAEAGIDAAIVQDIGLMSVLRRELPELELHASTQLNVRGKRGIELASRLGCSRVTLARELSIERIAELATLGVDLEVFVHGALCICQSGQCLLSSLIGGRSANRGLCAQPCRLPYKLVDKDGKKLAQEGQYLLSPRDLCGIEMVDRLIEADVASLKIEGRMKSPEYVSTVTSVYREAIDRAWEDVTSYEAAPDAEGALAEAFNRGFTQGYLAGERGNDMMGYKRPNNRGVAVGRVTGYSAGKVKLAANTDIAAGDLLEFWTSKGRVTYTVEASDTLKGATKYLGVREPVSVGDRVFRVRSAKLASDAQQRTEAGMKIPVSIDVSMRRGEPLEIIVHDSAGNEARATGPVVEEARTKAITREDVIDHVGRLGATPFTCEDWTVELDDGVGIGFSTLHKTRTAALNAFEEVLLAAHGHVPAQADAVDITRVTDLSAMAPFATAIDFDNTDIACTLEQFEPGCSIGPRMYATNIEAIRTWAALGASFIWLSPELTLHQMKLLADESPLPLGIIAIGRQELMMSDHCFLMAEGSCDEHCGTCTRRNAPRFLEDRKGYRFPVTTDIYGCGHIYNAVQLDVAHAIGDLLRAGIRGFAVDATLMSAGETEHGLNRVRSGINGTKISKTPDTTTGHLFRPVE
ncbi:MAG: U32 family peptidase [Coriobacteriales bacterium]